VTTQDAAAISGLTRAEVKRANQAHVQPAPIHSNAQALDGSLTRLNADHDAKRTSARALLPLRSLNSACCLTVTERRVRFVGQ